VIGTDGSEELFVLDGRTDEAPVLVFDLEAGELRPLAPDLEAWLPQLRAWQREVEGDREQMRRRYEARRWWQGANPALRSGPPSTRGTVRSRASRP
jgi:hypothetical protein